MYIQLPKTKMTLSFSDMQTTKAHSDVRDVASKRKIRRDQPEDIRSASGDGGADASGAPREPRGQREPGRVYRYVGLAAL